MSGFPVKGSPLPLEALRKTPDGETCLHPDWSHSRWCASCDRPHGPLFLCPRYPRRIRARVVRENLKFFGHDPRAMTNWERLRGVLLGGPLVTKLRIWWALRK